MTSNRPRLITEPDEAAELLKAGGLVAFPTETVFGLGVDATNAVAVDRLFQVKGRPTNNPLIVHVADEEDLKLASLEFNESAMKLLTRFAPGPLTVVVPKRPTISPRVTANLQTVGVRIPAVDATRQMLKLAGVPIAAPSANRSGRPSCTTVESVIEDFGSDIDGVLVGPPCAIGLESTVVDCTRRPPKLLRLGGVSLAELRTVVPELIGPSTSLEPGENSPGRLHPHYQPRAQVVLVDSPPTVPSSRETAYLGLDAWNGPSDFAVYFVFDDVAQYAQRFYEALRECDRHEVKTIFCQAVASDGIGAALMDRMTRAAEPRG